MSLFTIEHMTAGYGKKTVLQDISFTAEAHTLTGILGPTGCGKTTMIKAVCGNLPCKGNVTLDGQDLRKLSPRNLAKICAYIPQRSGISIDISLLDVVLMGFNSQLGLLERPGATMIAKAKEMLALVGLSDKAGQNFMHLSEGQKQLGILARALVSEGKLMLLDEPESALDIGRRQGLLTHMKQWVADGERCAILVLHDPNLALNACDQLFLLQENGEGSMLYPKKDTTATMEAALSEVYGAVSLVRCKDKSGAEHLVMLKEE